MFAKILSVARDNCIYSVTQSFTHPQFPVVFLEAFQYCVYSIKINRLLEFSLFQLHVKI